MPTGRRYHSKSNYDALAQPVVFDKAGAQTVASVGTRYVNTTEVPLVVKRVVAAVGTAPTGASLVVDALIEGTSVFTAAAKRATIAATTKQGEALADKTGDAVTVLPGQSLTVAVTQVGSTVAGSDLSVHVYFGWL